MIRQMLLSVLPRRAGSDSKAPFGPPFFGFYTQFCKICFLHKSLSKKVIV